MNNKKKIFLSVLPATVAATIISMSTGSMAADSDPIKVGVMLPFSGVYAGLGESTRNGLKQAIKEQGNNIAGRPVEFIEMDTEAKPARAPEITSSLVDNQQADFVIGPVHSGVAMGMIKSIKGKDSIMIIPNAGANAATGAFCQPNVFRTSFSSWQTAFPMGKEAYDMGYKKIVTMSWNYGFGKESLEAFNESFTKAGGEVIKEMLVPFPKTEFQSYLTEIASINPDAVFVFFAGGGAVKFVKDYDAMGLKGKIPLLGSGFLTEGTTTAQGPAAEEVITTLHYADALDIPKNKHFRQDYETLYGKPADLFAVQGYDAGQLIAQAVTATQGNTSDKAALIEQMEQLEIDSPRGAFHFSKSHNPIQTIYLRKVVDGQNTVVKVAHENLEDPARGCRL
ncbi:ABC transporter substrate-binding protein [Amphritea pacifica]|uniref:ABC transporter substrate-binding protein n=1 Tax=Amphritea pacifica TaxID=2811233 RepID=A0ABS2W3D5_9GAMM|nr:ABC transporter substrate-binding protein [Amphritea pacifica]MBN0986100.1 ABC transporter substrate-binding protein [Amphritea pacifica]MBN1007507.1 ABC transporter substrate-binding protein [Amphritea pacifica]